MNEGCLKIVSLSPPSIGSSSVGLSIPGTVLTSKSQMVVGEWNPRGESARTYWIEIEGNVELRCSKWLKSNLVANFCINPIVQFISDTIFFNNWRLYSLFIIGI